MISRRRLGRTFTYTAKTQVKYNFNSSGYMTSVVQPSGLQISYSYDAQNRLNTVQTPDGATTTLTYNSTTNNLQTISEPGSRSLSITINSSSGNLTGITDVDSTTRTLGYDTYPSCTMRMTVGKSRFMANNNIWKNPPASDN